MNRNTTVGRKDGECGQLAPPLMECLSVGPLLLQLPG